MTITTTTLDQQMIVGATERETCDLNGWGVGTLLRGHEQWADGRGTWTTIKITGLGETSVLARAIYAERTDPAGTIVSTEVRHDHEHTWTLKCRDWHPVTTDPRTAGAPNA